MPARAPFVAADRAVKRRGDEDAQERLGHHDAPEQERAAGAEMDEAGKNPRQGPPSRSPMRKVSVTVAQVASAIGSRPAAVLRPKAFKETMIVQKRSGGFCRRGMPSLVG